MMSKYIDIKIFLFSLLLGLLFMYLTNGHKKKVHVYPSPENWEDIIVKDKSNECFKFVQTSLECPADKYNSFSYTNKIKYA